MIAPHPTVTDDSDTAVNRVPRHIRAETHGLRRFFLLLRLWRTSAFCSAATDKKRASIYYYNIIMFSLSCQRFLKKIYFLTSKAAAAASQCRFCNFCKKFIKGIDRGKLIWYTI